MSEAKRWCFTINNPNEEDIELLIGTDADGAQAKLENVQYLIFQEERGENGTLHWQGFMILKTKKRLSWIKRNINGRAHWEVARGTNEQARDYCRKDDTYTGGIRHEFGSLPVREDKKSSELRKQAADELDVVKEGYKRPSEIDSMTLMQCGFIPAFKELTADILGPYRPDLKIITMIGPPGTGKSYAIQKLCPGAGRCIMGNNGVWFQNPTADTMVFEEFCGQIQLQRMLQFLDTYPLALEVKGGMRPAMYKTVIITSNTTPDNWYKGDDAGQPGKRTDAIKALWDRIGYSGGGYVPVRNCGTYLEVPHPAIGDNIQVWVQQCRDFFMREVSRVLNVAEDITDVDDP